jgi:hypothetical protein
MGSVGDAYDNAMAESFFATLECELLERQKFRNPGEAKLALFGVIEDWYNSRRRHSSLGNLSPCEFERRDRALKDGPVRYRTPELGDASTWITRSKTRATRAAGIDLPNLDRQRLRS